MYPSCLFAGFWVPLRPLGTWATIKVAIRWWGGLVLLV